MLTACPSTPSIAEIKDFEELQTACSQPRSRPTRVVDDVVHSMARLFQDLVYKAWSDHKPICVVVPHAVRPPLVGVPLGEGSLLAVEGQGETALIEA